MPVVFPRADVKANGPTGYFRLERNQRQAMYTCLMTYARRLSVNYTNHFVRDGRQALREEACCSKMNHVDSKNL